jgi:hypothetical protein
MKRSVRLFNIVLISSLLLVNIDFKAEAQDRPARPENYDQNKPETWEQGWEGWCNRDRNVQATMQVYGQDKIPGESMPYFGSAIGMMGDAMRSDSKRSAADLEANIHECDRRERLLEEIARENRNRPTTETAQPQQQEQVAQPPVDTFTQMRQETEAREAEERKAVRGGYEACMNAIQYMPEYDRASRRCTVKI